MTLSHVKDAGKQSPAPLEQPRPERIHLHLLLRATHFGSWGWVAISGALAATLVALQLPFAQLKFDDLVHRSVLLGHPAARHIPTWDMFRFFTGDPNTTLVFQDAGLTPWFADPELKLAFFRPLSSGLLALDAAVFGSFAPGYLLHGGLWYLALCSLVALWYQKRIPGLRGGLASVAFAFAGAHHEVVTWYAARNALVGAVFGMLALLAHERWREQGDRRARWMSMAALALALSAGEAALGALAFIAAFEWTRPAPVGARLRELWPMFAVVGLYLVVHVALGYGTQGSGAYIDPLRQPLSYLVALPERLLVSIGVLLFGLPSDLWFFVPATRGPLMGLGVVAALGLVLWLRYRTSQLNSKDRTTVRLLTLAMLGSLLPQMAGPLGPRSYLTASIAALGLLAMAVDQALRSPGQVLQRYVTRLMAAGLSLLHLVGGPLLWVEFTRFHSELSASFDAREEELDMIGPTLGEQDYFVLSAPDPAFGLYLPFKRYTASLPMPGRWRVLSLAECDHMVVRTSDHSFELELSEGDLLDSAFAEIFRSSARTFRVGQQVVIDGLSSRILSLSPRGQPRRIEFTTSRELDDPLVRLFAWDGGRMQPLRLVQGERRRLKWYGDVRQRAE